MSDGAGRDVPLIVTAVGTETRAVLAALRQPRRLVVPGYRAWEGRAAERTIRVVQAGIGPEHARAALLAMDAGHGIVVSAGFAGALVGDAAPGDIVLPETIVWEAEGTPRRYRVPIEVWQRAERALPTTHRARALRGPMLSSSTIIASPAAKQATGRRVGAVAVEMEAAGLIAVAQERGVGVCVLRVILDTAHMSLEDLPPNLDASWRARAQLIARPDLWSRVVALARNVPRVARVLTQASAVVLPIL